MLFDFRSISRPIIRGPISFIRFNWHANDRAYNFQYAVNLDNDVNNFIFVEWKSGNRREMVHENGPLATTTDSSTGRGATRPGVGANCVATVPWYLGSRNYFSGTKPILTRSLENVHTPVEGREAFVGPSSCVPAAQSALSKKIRTAKRMDRERSCYALHSVRFIQATIRFDISATSYRGF